MITWRTLMAIFAISSFSCLHGMESNAALFDAVSKADADRVQELLAQGVDPNIQDKADNAPLAHAAWQEISTEDQKIANDKIIATLLKAGADPNRANKNKQSPLMHAVARNKINIVKLLLDSGADVDAQDNTGGTPLLYAAYQDFLDSKHQEKVINNEIVKILLAAGANPNLLTVDQDSPIMWAVTRGKADTAKLLLEHKAAVNIKTRWERTPLSEAISVRPRNLVEIATLLLQHGADVNMQSRDATPLHQVLELSSFSPAAKKETIELVQLLLAAGADPNLQNKEKRTPLHIAVDKQIWDQALESYSIPLITSLINAGADPSIPGKFPGSWFYQTPLALYLAKYKVYRHGTKEDARIIDLLTVKTIPTTTSPKAAPAKQEFFELIDAVKNNNIELVTTMLNNGVNPNKERDKNHNSALHRAVENNNLAIVQLLIEHKANVHAKNNIGYTPLHKAADNGNFNTEIAQLLINAGANVNAKTEAYHTPLDLAVQWIHIVQNNPILQKAMAEFLILHGAYVSKDTIAIIHEDKRLNNKELYDLLVQTREKQTWPAFVNFYWPALLTVYSKPTQPISNSQPFQKPGKGTPTGGPGGEPTPTVKPAVTTGPGLLQRKHLIRAAIASTIGAALYGIYYFSTLEDIPTNLKWDELQNKLVVALTNAQYEYAYQLTKANPQAVQALIADGGAAQQELKKIIEQAELEIINETGQKQPSFFAPSASAQLTSLANLLQIIEQPANKQEINNTARA
jgi:ankyrin repeat protein